MEKKMVLIFGLFVIATVLCAFIPVNALIITSISTIITSSSSCPSCSYIPVGGELTSGGMTVLEGLLLAALVVAFLAGTILVARKLK
jgi:hypothetical protein